MRYLVALALILAPALGACGGDEESTPAPRPPQSTPAGPAAAKGTPAKKGKELKPMRRIEERVSCPTPSDAKKCDPKAPMCATGQYCIPAGTDNYCGVCPERDAIRHVFKPRDFQGPDIRDPFQSFVITQAGMSGPDNKMPTETTQKCTRKDQFVASSRSYQQLKLIGIVSQGTQRKVLLTDGLKGHIVKKGDCVGKEKAYVKDIGAGFITFTIEGGKADAAEYSMQLYPTTVTLGDTDVIDPGAASVPLVAPPTNTPPPPATTPQPQPGTTTTIIQDKPPSNVTVPPPAQAPTQLKP